MGWRGAAALSILLALASAGSAKAAEGYMPKQPKLGEFIATTPPRPAPALSFSNLQGKTLTLSDFKGKPVIVNLWATWCGPCQREMPSLDELQSQLGDKIAVVAISEDLAGAKVVEPFLAKLDFKSLKTYLDPKNNAGQAFDVRGLPTSLVIDKQGKVVGVVEGEAKWGSAKMRSALQPFLGGEPAVKSSAR